MSITSRTQYPVGLWLRNLQLQVTPSSFHVIPVSITGLVLWFWLCGLDSQIVLDSLVWGSVCLFGLPRVGLYLTRVWVYCEPWTLFVCPWGASLHPGPFFIPRRRILSHEDLDIPLIRHLTPVWIRHTAKWEPQRRPTRMARNLETRSLKSDAMKLWHLAWKRA